MCYGLTVFHGLGACTSQVRVLSSLRVLMFQGLTSSIIVHCLYLH